MSIEYSKKKNLRAIHASFLTQLNSQAAFLMLAEQFLAQPLLSEEDNRIIKGETDASVLHEHIL